jgi:hypothetical protein
MMMKITAAVALLLVLYAAALAPAGAYAFMPQFQRRASVGKTMLASTPVSTTAGVEEP